MTSDEAVQKAAKVIAAKTTVLGTSTMRGLDRAILAARALAEAGLLAPSPLRKEWGVRWHPDDPAEDIWDHYIDRRDAESGAGDEGEVVFRYVTDGMQE